MERGSKRHRKKSQSQLYWSNPVFLRALLDSFFIFISLTLYFHLAQLVIVTSESIRYILPDENEGHFPFYRNSQPHPYVQMVLRALASANNTVDFQMSSKWKLENRILNNALAV